MYFQFTLLVLSMKRSRHGIETMLWVFIVMSFGLIMAALAKLQGGNLSFIEGIVVSQLVWLEIVGMVFALILCECSKGVHAAAWLQSFFSLILTILMWIMSDKLPYGRCKSVRFVFMFGVDVPASGSGRIAALTFASMLLAVFTVYTLTPVGFGCDCPVSKRLKHPRNGKQEEPSMNTTVVGVGYPPYLTVTTRMDVLVSGLFIFGYFVSTTELIISRSHAEFSHATRTFGQVLAWTLLIRPCVALLSAIVEKRSEHKDIFPLSCSRVPTESGSAIQIPRSSEPTMPSL
ncbi:hypothetical protein JB92DRAFT_2944668 [Gautieria morchelliformis]|nr:hypothetical protein JB92DRAFT_2944668 [Gautieria morchelliformis]